MAASYREEWVTGKKNSGLSERETWEEANRRRREKRRRSLISFSATPKILFDFYEGEMG
jgi:hypothetical protein